MRNKTRIPPPKDVPTLDIDTSQASNVREPLAAHTKLETCAKCHRDIAPLGLSLEHYDAIGGWRSRYPSAPTPIDAQTELPDGTRLDGAGSIKQYLQTNRDIFTRCLLVKLLEYGTGRPLSVGDKQIVGATVRAEPEVGYLFQDLIVLAIGSDVFRAQ